MTDVCCNLFNVKRGQRSDSSISCVQVWLSVTASIQTLLFVLAFTWRTEQEVWTHLDCERSAWGHTLLLDLHHLLEVMWLRLQPSRYETDDCPQAKVSVLQWCMMGILFSCLLLMADTQSSMILYCRKTFIPCRDAQLRTGESDWPWIPPDSSDMVLFVLFLHTASFQKRCVLTAWCLLTCLDCFPHYVHILKCYFYLFCKVKHGRFVLKMTCIVCRSCVSLPVWLGPLFASQCLHVLSRSVRYPLMHNVYVTLVKFR